MASEGEIDFRVTLEKVKDSGCSSRMMSLCKSPTGPLALVISIKHEKSKRDGKFIVIVFTLRLKLVFFLVARRRNPDSSTARGLKTLRAEVGLTTNMLRCGIFR